jgi:hypothetical protein
MDISPKDLGHSWDMFVKCFLQCFIAYALSRPVLRLNLSVVSFLIICCMHHSSENVFANCFILSTLLFDSRENIIDW